MTVTGSHRRRLCGRPASVEQPDPGLAPASPAPAVRSAGRCRRPRGRLHACPLLYRFRVIDRLPEPPSPAAARGTGARRARAALRPARRRAHPGAARRRCSRPQWERLLERGARSWPRCSPSDEGTPDRVADLGGAALLERCFALEDPTRLEPAERELLVETDARRRPACCAATSTGSTSRPTGEMRVVDYKTGRAPARGFEAKALFQMRFYALVLWRVHGRVPAAAAAASTWATARSLRYEPDEADLLATERKVPRSGQAIERRREHRRLAALSRAGCATGATTRRCARRSAAPRRPLRPGRDAADDSGLTVPTASAQGDTGRAGRPQPP